MGHEKGGRQGRALGKGKKDELWLVCKMKTIFFKKKENLGGK